jgi:aqualysin 1
MILLLRNGAEGSPFFLRPTKKRWERMRKVVSSAALMGALLLLYAGGVLAQPQTPTQNIPDRYIVVFEEGVRDPAAVANEHARENGLQVRFVYTNAIEGYSAVVPNDRALQRVQNDPRVAYVEQDQVARAVAQTLPWGVDRVEADLSPTAVIDGVGAVPNVNAYIIDSGIYKTHADLNVVKHVNFVGDGKNNDCNGHGTHVAGTVAAKDNAQDVVGVAPDVSLTGVKVLGCSGSGSWSGVIKGVDWVTANAAKPAIANMSLGGGASQAVDDAVRKSANSGVFYSLAAGNDGANACNYSPARAGRTKNADGTWNKNNGVMTVAATNKSDGETSWSNYGACVDIWAPGYSILSTKKGGGTTTMSGTSMAAPHVGGGGALYLSSQTSASSSTVEVELKSPAQKLATKSKDGAAVVLEYVGGF